MNFFRRNKKYAPAAVQTVPAAGNVTRPFGEIYNYKTFCSAELKLYSALREAVPVIDAAISKIVRLTGEFRISCEDKDIEYRLNKFLSEVQVNACSEGAHSFISAHLNQLLTYGTAVGEMVTDMESGTIHALYNSSLHDVRLEADEKNPLRLIVCSKNKDWEFKPIKYPELILISALNSEPGSVYGKSLLKGLPFISDILLKIFSSIGMNWERVGNVRFAVTYKPPADAGERAYAKERAGQIAREWSKAMKSGNNPSDFISVGDVDIKVIGADNQILDSQVPVRQLLEQIISKLSIPPFLLGLSWSTSERMSTQQADILTSELDAYRRILNPVIVKICSVWLRINGFTCDFKVVWDNINLQDEVQLANARLMSARAREIEKRLEQQDLLEKQKSEGTQK